jgi:competence protein ComEC
MVAAHQSERRSMASANEVSQSDRYRPAAGSAARYQPLVLIAAASSAGVLLDRLWPLPLPAWALLAALALLAWLPTAGRRGAGLAALLLYGSCAALGGGWHHVRWNLFSVDDLANFATPDGGPVCLRARTVSNVSWLPQRAYNPLRGLPESPHSRVRLAVEAVRDGAVWRPASGHPTLTVDGQLPAIEPGTRLEIVAQLSRIAPPMNPGEFDYAAHARADRQLVRLWAESPAALTTLARPQGRWIAQGLNRVRATAARQLAERIAPERVGLANAILLGTRDQLDDLRTQNYFLTGMVHVLSISGLHVGILAVGLFWLLRLGLVGRRKALAAVALLTLAYAVLIGAEAPAVRATIIVLVACGSLAVGRNAFEFNTLAAAGLVVLIVNPADLFRAGPQLSFLAAATLGWLAGRRWNNSAPPDPLDQLIARSRPWLIRSTRTCAAAIGNMLLVSLAVWIITLPLVAWQFHIVVPAALVLTPLLAVPFAVSLFSGLSLVFLGWLAPPLAAVAGWLCDRSLAMGDAMVELGSGWPAGHAWIAGPAGWWVAGFYACALIWAAGQRRLSRRRNAMLMLAGWSVAGCMPLVFASRPHDELVCTFLSVGHGCAAVVETPDGKTLLYDAGRLGSPYGAARSVSAYLWSRGISRLDAVVVSHADIDHFNGLPELLERFPVDTLYLDQHVLREPPLTAELLIAAARDAGTRLQGLAAGDRLPLGKYLRASVLQPAAETQFEGTNANSVVLLLECDGRRLLLPGDLEGDGLARLLEQPPVAVDVLLAPHHGSPRSSPLALARWARPQCVVVSGSAKDDNGEVRQAYLPDGIRVLQTSNSGAVTITSSRRRLAIDCFRPGQ